MLELIVEFFFEFVLQFLGEALLEAVIQGFAGASEPVRHRRPILAFLGYALLGAALGGLSLLVFPKLFIRSPNWQIVNLIVTPLLAGLGMSAVGWLRRRQGRQIIRLDQFSYGFVFALGMALIRFLLGVR